MNYPRTQTVDHVDELHGVRVADPYRWLEEIDAPETRAWIEAQNRLTFGFLEASPLRAPLKRHLTELWDHEKFGVPWQKGGRTFFTRNDGLQNQAVLHTLEGELLDPNTLSKDGTVALIGNAVSHDGRWLAYGLASAGSDWQEWKVRDVGTGKDLEDHLRWIKFSGASWSKDNAGFYYSRYDEPKEGTEYKKANYHHKLYYHRLGTPQSDDPLIYERPDHKEWGFGGTVTDDGRYLVISVWKGTLRENAVFYRDGDEIVELLKDWDASYAFVDNDGTRFYFRTDRDAPKGRLIAIDLREPSKIEEVIPESEETLESVGSVDHRFIATYLRDAHTRVQVFDRGGRPERGIELPGLGTAVGFGGTKEDAETFFLYTSFAEPGTVYRHDMKSGRSEVFRRPKVGFEASDYETRQVFYPSRDGTKIPMFLVHRKGIEPDGERPTYLYGYGGFDIPVTPAFSVPNLTWMERGGLLAIANLRGGGEYGKAWHEAGMKLKKQNVFDDFIAAAEWLVAEGWTRAGRIAISGRSNGGLLVGACMTQRPDLFGACTAGVGVLDMLRFHKFTIGWAWQSDYGSPDDPAEFEALQAYSPYHNIREGAEYPPTLIYTGDHDDRVFPGHSFKFAARLQAAQGGPAPVLIRVDTRAGHGMGKPTAKLIDEWTDIHTFLLEALGSAS